MCYVLRATEGMLRIRDWLLITGYWDGFHFNKSFSKKSKPTLLTLNSSLFTDEVFL